MPRSYGPTIFLVPTLSRRHFCPGGPEPLECPLNFFASAGPIIAPDNCQY